MRMIGLTMACLAMAAAPPALAQTPPAGSSQAIPEKQGTTPMQGGDSLSSKLNKSGGVIAPSADVDPAIRVPAPDPHPNSTPVIPPAATGGNTAK